MELPYRHFTMKRIELAPLGISKRTGNETYFCTPKGISVINWVSVNRIHYCVIRGFGEMVFTVSLMNLAPHYVHSLVQNFSDFLRVLLDYGDCAALE